VQYATTFVLGLLLWLPAVVARSGIEEPDFYWGGIAKVLYNATVSFPVTGIVLAFLLTYVTGLFINRMATDYGLARKTSTLPLFIYILLTGFSPSYHGLSPFVVSLPLLTLFYLLLFKHYHNENNIFLSFDTGVILGVLALIYPPVAIMLLVIWISLLSFKGISWRNFTVSFMGLLFPSFLLSAYYIFFGQEMLLTELFPVKSLLNFNLTYFPFTLNSLLNLLFAMIVFITVIKVLRQQKNLAIQQRSHYAILGISLLILLFIQLFISLQLSTTLLLIPAGALTVSNMVSNSSLKPKWTNMLLVVVILISLANSFLPLLYVAE